MMLRRSPLRLRPVLVLFFCFLSPVVRGQSSLAQSDPKQAICQASWERCLGSGGGKNWKPIYDRCLKARTACLSGRSYVPDVPASFSSSSVLPQPMEEAGVDQANADAATGATLCENGGARGTRSSCVLALSGDGYGQSFSLLGPAVPLSRIQRASSVVKCTGGKPASFYSNGRIETCTLDSGELSTPLTDTAGLVRNCAARTRVRFDAEGRLLSCEGS